MATGKDPTSTEQLIKDLSAIDILAEDILTDRHEVIVEILEKYYLIFYLDCWPWCQTKQVPGSHSKNTRTI